MHYSRSFITKLNNKEIDNTFPSQTHHHARFSVYADEWLLFETMPNNFIPESVGFHVDQDDFYYDMIFYFFSISVGVHSEFV